MSDTVIFQPFENKGIATGDGSTDTFSIPFYLESFRHLRVQVYDTTTGEWEIQVEGTDYTIQDGDVVFESASIPPNDSGPSGEGNIEMWRVSPRDDPLPISAHRPSPLQLRRASLVGHEIESRLPEPEFVLTAYDLGTGLTSVQITYDGVEVEGQPMVVARPSTFEFVSVMMRHNDSAPPATWDWEFWHHESFGATPVKKGVFTASWASGALSKYPQSGKWQDPATGVDVVIDVDPGQMWHIEFGGSALDVCACRINCAYRFRVPHS